MKKIFLTFLIGFILLLAIIIYNRIHSYKKEQLQNLYVSTYKSPIEEKTPPVSDESDVKEFKINNYYIFEKENFIAYLHISKLNKNTLQGTLEIHYIQELFSSRSQFGQTWKIQAFKSAPNKWQLSYYDDNGYVSGKLEFLNNKLKMTKTPILDAPTLTLSKTSESDIEAKVLSLETIYTNKTTNAQPNPFDNLTKDKANEKIKELQSLYPVNSDNSLAQKGQTLIHIHDAYLSSLVSQLNTLSAHTQDILTSTQAYFNNPDSKNDPKYRDTMKKKLNDITKSNESFQNTYTTFQSVLSFYSFPNKEKTVVIDTNDSTSEKLIADLLGRYRDKDSVQFSKQLANNKIQLNDLYEKFNRSPKQ